MAPRTGYDFRGLIIALLRVHFCGGAADGRVRDLKRVRGITHGKERTAPSPKVILAARQAIVDGSCMISKAFST